MKLVPYSRPPASGDVCADFRSGFGDESREALPRRFVSVTPDYIRPGTAMSVVAEGFTPGDSVSVGFARLGSGSSLPDIAESIAGSDGRVRIDFVAPPYDPELVRPFPFEGGILPCVYVKLGSSAGGVAKVVPYSP